MESHGEAGKIHCSEEFMKALGNSSFHFIERGEVPARRLASSALNALRTQPWKGAGDGGWSELYTLVRNLALTTLDEEIVSDDVARLRPQEEADATVASLLPLLDQPLREARDAFEKIYFEHHLRLEGGNMTKLADKSGLERTHLYRKLKQLGVALGRRAED